jgi:hypothetical protein
VAEQWQNKKDQKEYTTKEAMARASVTGGI